MIRNALRRLASKCSRRCSFLRVCYRLIYLFIFLIATSSFAKLAIVVYALFDLTQLRDQQPQKQAGQVVCCCIVAGSSHNGIVVWLAFFAAMVHFAHAVILKDLRLAGDCRRCCNEAHGCTCGPDKDALPAGTLRHLARLIERRWSRVKKRANKSRPQ